VVIQLGDWDEESPEWDMYSIYLQGETVTYNGQEYMALKNVPAGKYPTGAGYSKNFWVLVE
jgi:chitodextrinase